MRIIFNDTSQIFSIEGLPNQLLFGSDSHSAEEVKIAVEHIISNIEKHPETVDLLRKVLRKGRINIGFLSLEASLAIEDAGVLDASWCDKDRKIEINIGPIKSSNLTGLLSSFLFELCNADNHELNACSVDDFDDPDAYATQNEILENKTNNLSCKLYRIGTEKYQWPSDIKDPTVPKAPLFMDDTKMLQYVREPLLSKDGHSHYDHYVSEFCEHKLHTLTKQILQLEIDSNMLTTETLGCNLTIANLDCKFSSLRLRKAFIPIEIDRLRMKDGSSSGKPIETDDIKKLTEEATNLTREIEKIKSEQKKSSEKLENLSLQIKELSCKIGILNQKKEILNNRLKVDSEKAKAAKQRLLTQFPNWEAQRKYLHVKYFSTAKIRSEETEFLRVTRHTPEKNLAITHSTAVLNEAMPNILVAFENASKETKAVLQEADEFLFRIRNGYSS